MDKKDSGQLMEKIFANLYNQMIPSSLNDDEPSTQFLSVMLPGITLDDKFDPSTYDGEKKLNQIVDRIPKVSKNYVDSARKVSQEYEKILSAVTPDDSTEAEEMKAKYEAAQKLLFQDGANTEEYETYLKFQTDYLTAQNLYLTECNKIPQNKDLVRELEQRAKTVLKNWVASGKAKIDEALDVMTRYRAFTPASVFSEAIANYLINKTDIGMRTSFVPQTWATDPESLSWETVTVMEGATEDHVHKDVSSVSSSFSAGFSAGLWGGSASGRYKKDLEKVQAESSVEKFGMRFEIARVDILRDWFNGGLLDYEKVFIPGVSENKICSGSLSTSSDCSFPLLPTALILARNITVYNEFSQAEKDYVNQSSEWAAKASVSYGPFSLGNDTKVSDVSEDERNSGFSASAKIEIGKKPQILGIISTVMAPAFPRTSGEGTPKMLTAVPHTIAVGQADSQPQKVEQMTANALNLARSRARYTINNM